jgi:general secretion pathway protein L
VSETPSGNVVRRFYAWWLNELARVLTPQRASANAWILLALNTADGLHVYRKSAGFDKPIATLPAESSRTQIAAATNLVSKGAASEAGRVLLRLSPSDIVDRTIQIPQAASDVIEPVLLNQMERIVPWSSEDRRYGYRVLGPNATNADQLDVQVVATTKNIIDTALHRARSIGLNPYAIDYASDFDAGAVELQSLQSDPVKKTAQMLQRIFVIAFVVCVAVGSFGSYHLWTRQTESDDLELKIATARARVEDVKRLNNENTELRRQRERLVTRKREEPAVITLIEAMSRTLPDNAYLTEMEIHGRETRIVGKSPDPTSLITKLEDTPQFEDVHFSSATTREEGETAGTFSIVGRAEGGPKEEKQP